MFYAVLLPTTFYDCQQSFESDDDDQQELPPKLEDLIFDDIKSANSALKKYTGSRMKTFETRDKALDFIHDPDKEGSFIEILDRSQDDGDSFIDSFEKLSIKPKEEKNSEESEFPSVKPAMLGKLRRDIEAGKYDEVEEFIWSNPRSLITCCDSANYLMAGPKYNACHIAARANRPDIIALILDTVSNVNFMKKLYPKESDQNVQDRVNHLLDSYLNTPDPRQGNTPLHFACKLAHYRVVRVLLTFEGCDLNVKDSNGMTAEESISLQSDETDMNIKQKIKDMFKSQLHLPLHRDQLKKRLLLAKRRKRYTEFFDSDISFSDDSFICSPKK